MHLSMIQQNLDKSRKQLHCVAITHIAPASYLDTSIFPFGHRERRRKVNVRT